MRLLDKLSFNPTPREFSQELINSTKIQERDWKGGLSDKKEKGYEQIGLSK